MICNLLMLAACWNINFQLWTEAFAMLVNVMWTALLNVWRSGSTCLKFAGNRLTSVILSRFHDNFQKKTNLRISVSGKCVNYMFKTCQTVAAISI